MPRAPAGRAAPGAPWHLHKGPAGEAPRRQAAAIAAMSDRWLANAQVRRELLREYLERAEACAAGGCVACRRLANDYRALITEIELRALSRAQLAASGARRH